MRAISNENGWSVLEVLCITVICILLGLILLMGINTLDSYLDNGNDAMMVNTAQSVARVDLATSDCVLSSCSGLDGVCTHLNRQGYTEGYYDEITHHIIARKPKGYNEFGLMKVGENYYRGRKKTMVIRIEGRGMTIKVSWVKGDNE